MSFRPLGRPGPRFTWISPLACCDPGAGAMLDGWPSWACAVMGVGGGFDGEGAGGDGEVKDAVVGPAMVV